MHQLCYSFQQKQSMRGVIISILCFVGLVCSAQSLFETQARSSHYFYYKLNQAQAYKYYANVDKVKIEELATQFVKKAHSDSLLQQQPTEPGHYLQIATNGSFLNHHSFKVPYFHTRTQGYNGEGHLYLYNPIGEKLEDVSVSLKDKPIPFNDGCGCYLFEKEANGQLITLKRGEQFDFLRISVPGKKVEKTDKSNPYRGTRIFPGYMVFNKPKYRHFDTLKSKAFITNWKGRPIRRKAFYYMQHNGGYSLIGKVKPISKGAYVFNTPLSDSLKLDRSYRIDIRSRDSSLLKSAQFYLEDYELDKVDYSCYVPQPNIGTGQEYEFRATARDKNGLPALDTRIKWTFYVTSIGALHQPDLYVPDSAYKVMYEGEKPIDATGTNLISIPDSLYYKADASHGLKVEFINADGVFEHFDFGLSYRHLPEAYRLTQKGSKLKAEFLENNESSKGEATMYEYGPYGLIRSFKADLPLEYQIPNNAISYQLKQGDSILTSLQVGHYNPFKLDGKRTSTQIGIKFNSSDKWSFYYRIYDDHKLIKSGADTALHFSKDDGGLSSYYLVYGYTWRGQEWVFENSFHLKEKELTIDIQQPEKIFPGEEIAIGITVTNYKGEAQKDVNLTAWSVNTQFEHIPLPEMPYFGRRFPQRTKTTVFQISPLSKRGNERLNYSLAGLLNLSQYDYYRFRFPADKIQAFEQKIADKQPEFAPFVCVEDTLVKIEAIKVDNQLVYLASSASANQPYSFLVEAGRHTVEVRTGAELIVLKDVDFRDSTKTVLSFDPKKLGDQGIVSEAQPGHFSEQEWAYIRKNFFLVSTESYMSSDTSWIIQNDRQYMLWSRRQGHQFHLMYSKNVGKTLYVFPFLKNGPTQLKLGNDSFLFYFNPDNYYVWTEGKLQNFEFPVDPINWSFFTPKARFPQQNWIHHKTFRTLDEIKSRKPIKHEEVPEIKSEENYVKSLLDYRFVPDLGKTKLQLLRLYNPHLVGWDNFWILSKDRDERIWAYDRLGKPTYQDFYLPKGQYTAVLLKNNNRSSVFDFEVKPGHQFMKNLETKNFSPIKIGNVEPLRKRVHKIARPAFGNPQVYPKVYPTSSLEYEKNGKNRASVSGTVRAVYSGYRVYGAEVFIERNGEFVAVLTTNSWGEFEFENLPSGVYQVKIRKYGYYYALLYNIKLVKGAEAKLDVSMVPWKRNEKGEVIVAHSFDVKLDSVKVERFYEETIEEYEEFGEREAKYSNIEDSYGGAVSLGASQVRSSNRSLNQAISSIGGISSIDGGTAVIRGGRTSGNLTLVDGIPVRGSVAVPPSSYGDSYVWDFGSGIPAEYGDATVGIVEIVAQNGNEANVQSLAKETDQTSQDRQAQYKGRIRNNFRDYAFWIPNLVTDDDGEAHFTAKFPDNITQWKTIVPAMDGHRQTGLGIATTKAYLPLSAQLGLPRFLVEGDEVEINGKVFNYTDSATNFKARFALNDSLLLQADGTSEKVDVFTTSLSHPKEDSIQVTFAMKTEEGFEDGEQRDLRIYPSYLEKTTSTHKALEDGKTMTITLGKAEAKKVIVHNTEQQLILERIKALKNYRYGCNEQTASKLSALVLERSILEELGQVVGNGKSVAKMISRLSKTQRVNGSWGWWQNGSSDPWMTMYIVEVLGKAESNGFNNASFNKGLRYVRRKYKKFGKTNKLKAYNLLLSYSIAPDTTGFYNLTQSPSSTYEKLLIVNVKQQLGMKVNLQREVISLVQKDGCGRMLWGENNYRYNSNATMSTVLAYKAIRRSKEPKFQTWLGTIEDGLLYGNCTDRGYNTLEMAQILEMATSRKGNEELGRKLRVNGALVTKFPFMRELSSKDTLLLAVSGNDGFMVSQYDKKVVRNAQSHDKDFVVRTNFVQGKDTVKTAHKGKTLIMQVQVIARTESNHVMVEVPIPAGCSYENKRLGLNSKEVHREYFRDKVAIFFEDMPPGTHQFSIHLQPRFSGSFHVVPAKAELMYFPDKNGHNGLKEMEIKAQP